jgi:ribonuclease HI
MRNAKEPALNPDLWERLLRLAERHRVRFEWLRGHAGHPQNERSHHLSIQAAQSPNLPRDEGYETSASSGSGRR